MHLQQAFNQHRVLRGCAACRMQILGITLWFQDTIFSQIQQNPYEVGVYL